ncbi:uncharacterized protein DS421_6g178210 [Arachis hypogaea]|nr:uncharacterized protein DS421_6g178210 [Arachis hypogaea]
MESPKNENGTIFPHDKNWDEDEEQIWEQKIESSEAFSTPHPAPLPSLHDLTSPSSNVKPVEGEGLPDRTLQRTPPTLTRRPSFPARMRPVGLDVPNATNDNGKSGTNRTAQEPDISCQLTNGNVPHLSRPAAREHQKAFGRNSKGMQTDSNNSASSSVQRCVVEEGRGEGFVIDEVEGGLRVEAVVLDALVEGVMESMKVAALPAALVRERGLCV